MDQWNEACGYQSEHTLFSAFPEDTEGQVRTQHGYLLTFAESLLAPFVLFTGSCIYLYSLCLTP